MDSQVGAVMGKLKDTNWEKNWDQKWESHLYQEYELR